MGIQIDRDLPSHGAARAAARGGAFVSGLLLLVLAAVVVTLSTCVGVLILGDHSDGAPGPGGALPYAGVCAAGVVLWWAGWRLFRGRRRVGLFLRKFGLADSTRALTFALATVGPRLRLITLDDAIVVPLGQPRSRRRIAVAAVVLGVVLLVVIALCVYQAYRSDPSTNTGSASTALNTAFTVVGGPVSPSTSPVAPARGDVWGTVGTLFKVLVIIFVAALLLVALVAAVAVGLIGVGGGSYLAIRAAQRGATRSILTEPQITPVVRQMVRRSRHILGPRLVVVAVAGAIWQHVVDHLAQSCDLVIIDISQPTDNLVWEVETIRTRFPGRWLLVGDEAHLTTLTDAGAHPAGSPQARLITLLDGEHVLAYGPTPELQRRFTRALRGRLDHFQAPRRRRANA
jgi:hypothetical protein